MIRSRENVVLADLRTAVAAARAWDTTDSPDLYQKAVSRVLDKRAYDGGYVSLDWVYVTDTDTLDFAQKVLERLANLERMG